jgi:hypothetical protein
MEGRGRMQSGWLVLGELAKLESLGLVLLVKERRS